MAIFAFLPDAAAAIEQLELNFEKAHPHINVEFELWDPYSDSIDDDGLEQLTDFDIAEIDTCRIDDLIAGAFGGIDPLPAIAIPAATNFLPPARALMLTARAKYIVPHLVCGNFLVFRSTESRLTEAESFDELLQELGPKTGCALFADLWGSTGLGEYYADAVIDQDGIAAAREHLLEIYAEPGDHEPMLKAAASEAILKLIAELPVDRSRHLAFYHAQSFVYPRDFASYQHGALLGYSERLYYVERELQLRPALVLPCLKATDVVVRPFSFGERSQGTPTWIDGFVVPKGRLARKPGAILAFLSFIQSKTGYRAFSQPTAGFASSYLLPASVDVLNDTKANQPVLPSYAAALDDTFPILDARIWRAMKRAGNMLKKTIEAKFPQG